MMPAQSSNRYGLTSLLAMCACLCPDDASAQVKPAMSGQLSFYEPEGDPKRKGWYYPNVPGSPSVSRYHGRSRDRDAE